MERNSLGFTIQFPGKDDFIMDANGPELDFDAVPSWAQLKNMPCPGNIKHGPHITYCRLAVELNDLVEYFSDITSIEQGTLIFKRISDMTCQVKADGQNIFFRAVWLVLLSTNCSVLKWNRWIRGNYVLSTDVEKIFYLMFSTFLCENYFIKPGSDIDVTILIEEIRTFNIVITNLIKRVRKGVGLQSDSVNNGLIMLSSVNTLLEISFDELLADLRKKIVGNTALEHWI